MLARTDLERLGVPVMVAEHAPRMARFVVVGVSGVVVNSVILFSLVHFAGWNHLLGAAVASELSILSNFILNDSWTFRDAQRGIGRWRRAVNYNGVALVGMSISLCVLALLTDRFGMHYLLANLFAISTATFTNYVMNSRFTWAIPKASGWDPGSRFEPIPVEAR